MPRPLRRGRGRASAYRIAGKGRAENDARSPRSAGPSRQLRVLREQLTVLGCAEGGLRADEALRTRAVGCAAYGTTLTSGETVTTIAETVEYAKGSDKDALAGGEIVVKFHRLVDPICGETWARRRLRHPHALGCRAEHDPAQQFAVQRFSEIYEPREITCLQLPPT